MGASRLEIAVGVVPVPAWVRRVLVFGGTFDPPHAGHVVLPDAVRAALGFEWVMYVPAARSPHKASGPVASDEDRVAMLVASLRERAEETGDEVRASVCTLEIERARGGVGAAGPVAVSYTVDTLRALRAALPGVTMRLLIGADQAAAFGRWHEPREIIGLAEPVVMLRLPMESVDGMIEAMRAPGGGSWSEEELAAWRGRVVEVPLIDAEATRIRAGLARGGVDDELVVGRLARAVREMILERGLYRVSG
jgi:nicotinate-nucleotide adenylyltransferase